MRFRAGVEMAFPSALWSAARRVSNGTAGFARACPTVGSATTAAAVSSSARHVSTVPSRMATSKAASA